MRAPYEYVEKKTKDHFNDAEVTLESLRHRKSLWIDAQASLCGFYSASA